MKDSMNLRVFFAVSDGVFGRGDFKLSKDAIDWAEFLVDCNLIVETWIGNTKTERIVALKRDGEWRHA